MARAGQRVIQDEDRLENRISIGILIKMFPRDLIEEVIETAGAHEQRHRLLPSWLVVYYVLALALFMDLGGGRVIRKLSGTLSWAAKGVTVAIPSDEALSRSRIRLGSLPLKMLFEKVAVPLANSKTPGGFFRGLRILSIDGTTLDIQDTEKNWKVFGGPTTKDANGQSLRGGFPQLRVVALAECSTRALIGATVGSYNKGEKTLTLELLPRFKTGQLIIADRNFPGYELWCAACATGAELLWRASTNFELAVEQVLDDGSYLSKLKTPKALIKKNASDVIVRVVKYYLSDDLGEITETFTLITTLLDPIKAPARELAELYHDRWSIETAFSALKSQLRGKGVVLRSKTPDGAEQELWAMLCAYQAVRDLICASATLMHKDPLRISFITALDAVRNPIGETGSFFPSPTNG